ncbi:hypothetical protein [Tenacibaculum maritimum]|uniref:hypothetical protein n=1 Tax=Tenacibaculum maritimum TaxID=107401 RepID=UPI001330867C|nr:hypothetical protein [Tenacibaculum maritimum]
MVNTISAVAKVASIVRSIDDAPPVNGIAATAITSVNTRKKASLFLPLILVANQWTT